MKTSVRMLKTSGGLYLLYAVSFCFCLVHFTWLWESWGVALGDSSLFVRLLPPVSTSVPVHDSPLWVPRALGPPSACGAAFAFSSFIWRFHRAPEGFFFLRTVTGLPVSCKELSSCERVRTSGPSSECSLFHSSPSSEIKWGHGGFRGAWFSRLVWHPARRRSGSILSPGTHTGLVVVVVVVVVVVEKLSTVMSRTYYYQHGTSLSKVAVRRNFSAKLRLPLWLFTFQHLQNLYIRIVSQYACYSQKNFDN